MVISEAAKKRYGVYVFFDADGIADEYNFYFLKELKKELSHLLVICNGKIDENGRKRFREIADEFLERENKGYDITAYNIGLSKCGYNADGNYDEVVICNSTMFGPFYPFSEMFDAMARKDIDFWGISNFHGAPFDPFGTVEYGYLPKHVQSFFMVFRKSLTMQKDFTDYWKNMPEITSYEQAIGFHEAIFTKKFEDKGYKWDVYVNSDDLEGYTLDPLRDFPGVMIDRRRCPIIKKRSFFHDYGEAFSRSAGEGMQDAMKVITEKTDYDVNLIWTNILRLQNMSDVKKRMQLNYVLPTKKAALKGKSSLKTALVIHIYYDELADMCCRYALNTPEWMDIFVTVPNEEKLEKVKKSFEAAKKRQVEFRIVGNIGRDVAPFLTGCKDLVGRYDLICKVHDKKVYQIKPMVIGESWGYMCFENMLANENYVRNIINLFEKNEKLGMLMPPIPVHGPYYPTTGKGEWGENFPDAQKLADKLKLKVDITKDKEPVAPLGSMFWVRTAALRGLFAQDWQYKDFPPEPIADDHTVLHAIERIYPFCVQNEGYYSGWVMAETFAGIHLTNLNYMNHGLRNAASEKYGTSRLRELTEKIYGN
jgi:rhamnosyltransferase